VHYENRLVANQYIFLAILWSQQQTLGVGQD
jgi:hypothetical protein